MDVNSLNHKTLETKATATDQGVFSALAACYSVDRVGERIVPGAFAKTIAAWQRSPQRSLPVHWDHRGSAADIIGAVDVASMEETADGLYVEGKLDLEESETAREAWRSMKNNAVALSFGFLATKARESGDITELLEIDLFEISVVAAPANADTRFLSLKNVGEAVADKEGRLVGNLESVQGEIPEDVGEQAWNLVVKNLVVKEPRPKAEPELTDEALDEYRAVWTEDYIKALPDSAFLYIDEDKKKAKHSRRQFPYRDADGAIDLPHLRSALSHIPQASLSQKAKARLVKKAQAILNNATEALSDMGEEKPPEQADPPALTAEAWKLIMRDELKNAKAEPELDEDDWTLDYVKALPDKAFLLIEDDKQKAKNARRHFPYRDIDGAVDLPHLRDSLTRIPQSNLPQDEKDRLTEKAQTILDNAIKALTDTGEEPALQVEDGGNEEPEKAKSAPQDPLVKEAWELVVKHAQPEALPEQEPEPEPEVIDPAQLEREAWALAMKTSGT